MDNNLFNEQMSENNTNEAAKLQELLNTLNEHEQAKAEAPPLEVEDFDESKAKDYADENDYEEPEIIDERQSAEPPKVGEMIDTDLLILIVDVILSRVLFLIFGKALKKDVVINDFALTPEESKALSKLLKEYLKTTEIKVSPLNALIIGVVSVYGGKALIAFSQPKQTTVQNVKEATKRTGKRGRPRKIKEGEQ